MHDHETAIIDAFFLPEKRERFRMLLGNPRRRTKALDSLNYNPPLDRRYAIPVAAHELEAVLRKYNPPETCYVLSAIPDLDGREMNLEAALLESEHGYWGTLIGCIPGRLAVYLGEGGEQRLLLRRTS